MLGDAPLAPTSKSFKSPFGPILEGFRILQDVTIRHTNIEAPLDFHVFDIQDFDVLIGHPIEKLLMDVPTHGNLNVKLGGNTFSVPISRSRNSLPDPPHEDRPIEEVMTILPFDSPQSLVEEDAKEFI
ncbi:hypothetical protein QOZ80_3BG0273060 [Eleusine coracana subsp. coracana]|nr:hypothetical protein QOZ80_3BG0273060 [Eleusine coracana subsp. coracana]